VVGKPLQRPEGIYFCGIDVVEFNVVADGGFHLLRGVRGPDSRDSGREAVPVQVQVQVEVWACLARGRGAAWAPRIPLKSIQHQIVVSLPAPSFSRFGSWM